MTRRTRANAGTDSKSKNGPVTVIAGAVVSKQARTSPLAPAAKKAQTAVARKAWDHALLIAKGDASRLKVADDGSVLVLNKKAATA